MSQPARRTGKARVPRNALLRGCSSVRLGLLLILAIAVYAALGTVSLAGAFETLGGEPWAPGRTIRHLPWIDLREQEYYSTDLFGALLLALVVNMSLATVLRIPWRPDRAGVILTHAAVAVLAIGAFVATRSPVNATIALFAGEPSGNSIDRSRSVLEVDGVSAGSWRLDQRLPRYADFGVPWSDRDSAIALDDGVRVTGFAHSARVVSRLERGSPSDPPGWQLDEVLATGERRTLCLIAAGDDGSRKVLADGTVLLALGEEWPIPDVLSTAIEQPQARGIGLVWIEPQPGVTLALPASRGASAFAETEEGVWQAEFLDRAEFIPGTTFGNYRLSGPGFRDQILYAASWDPRVQGRFADGSADPDGQRPDLPDAFRSLFLDAEQPAIVLHPEGLLRARENGLQRVEAPVVGDVISTSAQAELRTARVESNARVAQQVERLPLVEDPQLLADPRLGSAVRVEWETENGTNAAWLGFDDSRTPEAEPIGLHYGPQRFEIADTALTFRSFKAELFRRGSVPKDFQIGIELNRVGEQAVHTLSLNEPIRTTIRIRDRDRRVQLSLIGWDAAGWEASRGQDAGQFEGVRYVILSMNQREGVGTALFGVVLILLGAGYSLVTRLVLPVTRPSPPAGERGR